MARPLLRLTPALALLALLGLLAPSVRSLAVGTPARSTARRTQPLSRLPRMQTALRASGQGDEGRSSSGGGSSSSALKNFVPIFVGVWALGYTAIAAQQVLGWQGAGGDSSLADAQKLGETGGLLGVALTVGLFLALVAAAAFESFKE